MADPGGRGAVAAATRNSFHGRRGVGNRQLLFVLGLLCFALIFVVLLHAIGNMSEARPRLQCESQLRNLSTAFHTYAVANGGALPLARGHLIERDADPDNSLDQCGWPVQLLPYVERSSLFDALLSCTADGNRDFDNPNNFTALSRINLPYYTCPASPRAEHPGALGFVVNMGYMTSDIWDDPAQGHRHQVSGTYNWNNGPFDENSAEDAEVSRATGVVLHDPTGRPLKIDDIQDGASQTILLTENLNAGWWVSGAPHETGLAVRIGGTSTRIPTAGQSAQGLGDGTQETALQFHTKGGRATIDLGPSAINANFDSESHSLPRPSSLHPGGVNLFFCDGSGRFVSEEIDPSIYARLVSSAGTKFGLAIVRENDF